MSRGTVILPQVRAIDTVPQFSESADGPIEDQVQCSKPTLSRAKSHRLISDGHREGKYHRLHLFGKV